MQSYCAVTVVHPDSLVSTVSLSLMLATAAKASTYTISTDVRRIRSLEVYELLLLLETSLLLC